MRQYDVIESEAKCDTNHEDLDAIQVWTLRYNLGRLALLSQTPHSVTIWFVNSIYLRIRREEEPTHSLCSEGEIVCSSEKLEPPLALLAS